MRAPSYEVLLSISENLELDFLEYLNANGLNPFISGAAEDRREEMIALRIDVGGATGHVMTRDKTGTGEPEFDWFNGSLTVEIQTPRVEEGDSINGISNHGNRVTTAKKLFLRGVISGNLPGVAGFTSDYYEINEIQAAGENKSVTETGNDVTSLGYNILICVKPDAWPEIN